MQSAIVSVSAISLYQNSRSRNAIAALKELPTVYQGYNEEMTRTIVFSTLLMANIFLSLFNRSFYYTLFTIIRYKNNLLTGMVFFIILMLTIMLYVPPVIHIFKFEHPGIKQLLIYLVVGFLPVIWIEFYKYFKRRKNQFT